MQTHYFELRAIPQIELTEVMVVNQLMQSLHYVLAAYKGNVSISFPCYTIKQSKTLGGIIRIFSDEATLVGLKQALSQQPTVIDYAILLNIKPVPIKVNGYLCVSRVRAKGQSALKRAEKRLTEQGKWSNDVKAKMIAKWGSVELNYPHCHLTSSSTGQRFILWVKQWQCQTPKSGVFNNYGMSQSATVPDF